MTSCYTCICVRVFSNKSCKKKNISSLAYIVLGDLNLVKKYLEGYFHGFKWIKRKRKKHPCHQYFIISDG